MIKIDIASLLGFLLGFITLILGMVAKGANPLSLINPAAFIIIFIGTASSILISFPMEDLKKLPKLLKIIFKKQNIQTEEEFFPVFLDMADTIKKQGVVGLEQKLEEIQDPFFRRGIELILEGKSNEEIEEMMHEDLEGKEERHKGLANIFTQAGAFAPTLGVLGAVMGLMSALGHLDNIALLGPSISAAFTATLWGIFMGYVMMHPMANKLKRKSSKEARVGKFIIAGIMALQAGSTALTMQSKLLPFLPTNKRDIDQLKGNKKEVKE